jgi:hypothetical protein
MTINRSAGKPNWSQRKNAHEPLSTCNVTACINAAQSCNYDVMACRRSTDPNKRPSDDFYEFIHSDPDVQNFYRSLGVSNPPNQIMEVLAYALGQWLRAPGKVTWHSGMDITVIGRWVRFHGCAVVHGRYPCKHGDGSIGKIEHITALVGLNWSTYIDSFIMDDSYGDYRLQYAAGIGDDIIMSMADAQALLKCGANTTPAGLKDAILIESI